MALVSPGKGKCYFEIVLRDVDGLRRLPGPGRQNNAARRMKLLWKVDVLHRPMGPIQFPLPDVELESERLQILGRQERPQLLDFVFDANPPLPFDDVADNAEPRRQLMDGFIREDRWQSLVQIPVFAERLVNPFDQPSEQRQSRPARNAGATNEDRLSPLLGGDQFEGDVWPGGQKAHREPDENWERIER
jgi:hypothetical protein